ncbi:MAG: ATP-binding protein, partial [Thermotogaceae bacterium]|nr:ATP-binding protein [Thermotogaceae bacterium]
MRFYNRKKELEFFEKVKKMDKKYFVAIYGRRRIGKTMLIKKAFEDTDAFYYFVEVKKEETLLRDLSLAFSKAVYTDWYSLFSDLFKKYEYIVFDEFQNFFKVNPSIMYALQHAWDENEHKTKLIVLGSCVGLMKNIFMNEKMPLFGRVDNLVKIREFTLRETLL